MNSQYAPPIREELPSAVRAVLHEAAQQRFSGEIPQRVFDREVARLATEVLAPRGLALMVRVLGDGTTRFLVKSQSTGAVCDMIECHSGPA